jgi:alpha-L-fucosidase
MTARPGWFEHDRFGMFIHWGLYALAARHEWVKSREQLTTEDYQAYVDHFDPDLFDPREWARQAKDAGMKYVVFTSKHHDGFCMWDTEFTDYKVTNSPYGKDVLRMLLDAVRAEGLRVGIYHSLIDWHHEDFPSDNFHPMREDASYRAGDPARDMSRYVDQLHAQVRELLTGYGPLDYLFFDFSYKDRPGTWGGKGAEEWRSEELLTMVRELQPQILVNDRLGIPGDFVTPEQYTPLVAPTLDGRAVAWESNNTMNGSWGYDRDNHAFKSADMLVRMLVNNVSLGGNLLLNVGPDGRGRIDPLSSEALESVGAWMELHSRAIYGCGPSRYAPPSDIRYTQNGNRLYAHILAWPQGFLHLPELAEHVAYAQLLQDASEVDRQVIPPDQVADTTILPGQPKGTLTLTLPTRKPDVAVPVIELFLREER